MFIFGLALVMSAAAGYLLGSINCAILISRLIYKQDVRELGSGNAGMTNVARNFGKKGAMLTLGVDVSKGILAVWAGRWLIMLLCPGIETMYGAYIGGIFAILGHMFPLYFGFKGGKGVAVSGGVIIALQPLLAAILLLLFLIVTRISKMVSLGSIVAISMYPVATLAYMLILTKSGLVFSLICSAIVAGLVVVMHRSNIQRIIAGTENKIGQKKKDPPA